MRDWKGDFLEQSLRAIPDGAYRKRMEAELTDHLAALSEDLQAAGWPEQEARAAALERMGGPKGLNQAFRKNFSRHEEQRKEERGWVTVSCIWVGTLYLLTMMLLGAIGFTADASFPDRISFPLYGHPVYCAVFGSVLSGVTFLGQALFLRWKLGRSCRRRSLTAWGLLVAWSVEKLAAWSISWYLPYFSPAYVVLSLIWCLLLWELLGAEGKRCALKPE